MDFVKILKFDQDNIKEGLIINVTEENQIRLSGYNFLIKVLETYNKRKFENDELLTEIIKLNLPAKNEEKAREQWFNGVTYNNYKYVAWFASVSGMKIEENGVCDTFFIREDYISFTHFAENLISLGKFSEIEAEEKVICINKDVLSRISLMTTDLITEIDMPNFIVLPQAELKLIRDYKIVEPFIYKVENKKGEESEKIDYKLEDYHFDDMIDIFDGGGIGTPKVFESIGKTLRRNDIEFAIIRGYGAAIKGLITKFDIIRYLDKTYKEDTHYLKKKDGIYYLMDMWGVLQPVTDNTILLNESMVKLAKYFKGGMKEYTQLLNMLKDEEYLPYYNLLTKLYISKVNKEDREISSYRRINYQILNALALTPKEYQQLIYQDYRLFKKILKPYTHIQGKDSEEFIANIDYINLFYKQCIEVSPEDSEKEITEKVDERLNNSVDKVHELININPNFVKLNYAKKNLAKLIEKKVREFAAGAVTIKAKYQYIAIDPISYMNFAMYRDLGEKGLNEGEFYSYDCDDGVIRTIARNPLCAYSEIHNVKFVRNAFFDNYLSHCKELIYFNMKSDILSLMSSADCDGDACTVIDEPIIRNAVVVPKDGRYFITLDDGKKELLAYNNINRFISTYRAAGNLIGKISLKAAGINSNCQVVPNYYNTVTKDFVEKYKLKEEFIGTEEEFEFYLNELINKGQYVQAFDVPEELKEYIKQQFYNYEREIYIVLHNAMKAIDSPKKLIFPTKADMEVIDSKYFKKAHFLQFTKQKDEVISREYTYTGGLLDMYASFISRDLLDTIKNAKQKFSSRHDLLQKHLANNSYNKDTYESCLNEIIELYSSYNLEISEIDSNLKKKKLAEYDFKKCKSKGDVWTSYDEKAHTLALKKYNQERNKDLKKLDAKYIPLAEDIVKTYGIETVGQAISNLEKCTENFILNLFWCCFTSVGARYIYQESEDGEIEYLYRKYKKVEISEFSNNNAIKNIEIEEKVRLDLYKKVRLKIIDSAIVSEISEKLEQVGEYKMILDDKRIKLFQEYKPELEGKDNLLIIGIDKIHAKSLGLTYVA